VNKFLEAGGYVDIEFESGSTPLIMAVEDGLVEVAKLLLSAGASIYRVNSHGETAFARAVQCEDTILLNILWRLPLIVPTEVTTARPS
jgi:ankyrin repeat protein